MVLIWSQADCDRKAYLLWQKHLCTRYLWPTDKQLECEDSLVTLVLTSKHWTAWAAFRLLQLYMHKKSFHGSGIKLLSFLFHSSFCTFPSPSSIFPKNVYWLLALNFCWNNDEQIIFCGMLCTSQLYIYIYLFFFLINNTAVFRFWSFKLRIFRDR